MKKILLFLLTSCVVFQTYAHTIPTNLDLALVAKVSFNGWTLDRIQRILKCNDGVKTSLTTTLLFDL